jgi:hypothetical protein
MGDYLRGSVRGRQRKEGILKDEEDGSILHIYIGRQNKETH